MTSLPTTSRRAVLAVGGTALALVLAACGGGGEDSSTGRPQEEQTGEALDEAGEATSATGGGDAGDRDIDRSVPYLQLPGDSDGPVVDLLLDFRCPPCRGFMESFGQLFRQKVERQELVLRIHPRPMLDLRRGTTFSQDSAAAAAAVYAQDPQLLMDFEAEMYAAQPASGDEPDPDLEQIATIAQQVGADETCLQQIRERVFVPWTLEVVEPAAQALEVGTPTMIIDGQIWGGDWTQPGAVEQALEL